LGEDLLIRVGRNLQLTEIGRLVLSYTEEIFSLTGELEEMVRNLPDGRPLVFKGWWPLVRRMKCATISTQFP